MNKTRLGCNYLQANMGCKKAGGNLAELIDKEKETSILSVIDEEVSLICCCCC